MKKDAYKHIRINEETGEAEYYFPMEIENSESREWAKAQGFEICKSRLGNRTFDAIMIPCKEVVSDETGNNVFLETSPERQKKIYSEYIKDEMDRQESEKEDSRCIISNGRGKTKRCPLRVPNPEYTPGSGESKTVAVRCEGCKNEPYKQAHFSTPFSALETDSVYEPYTLYGESASDKYDAMRIGFVNYVKEREPSLALLADMLTEEYSKADISRALNEPRTTIVSRTKKLMVLVKEYLDEIVD